MTYTAIEFNFQQVLLKTLIPTMNTLKDTLNIINTDGKWAPEAKREGLELILMCFSPLFYCASKLKFCQQVSKYPFLKRFKVD